MSRLITVLMLTGALLATGCNKTNAPEEASAEPAKTEAKQEAKTDTQASAKVKLDLKKEVPAQDDKPKAAPEEAAPAADIGALSPSKATEKAPAKFKAKFVTSKGEVVVEVYRDWAPNGADRFYNLVKMGFFDGVRFFRVLKGFVAQFGINGDPAVMKAWRDAKIQDDPVKETNARGTLVFATSGPNTRTTQLFINFGDNKNLDGMGFSPFGKVVKGMDIVDSFYMDYGEGAPRGRGPSQGLLQEKGNAYLEESFPKLDYVKTATILE